MPDENDDTTTSKGMLNQLQDLTAAGTTVSQAVSTSASPLTPLEPSATRQPFHTANKQHTQHVHDSAQSQPILSSLYPAPELELHSTPHQTDPEFGSDTHRPLSESVEPTADEESQFIGHTNPQGIFLAGASPTTSTGSGGGDKIGFWLPRSTYEHIRKHRKQSSRHRSNTLYTQDRLVSKILLPWIFDQNLRLLPDPDAFAALHNIYRTEVHPIFPVVEFDMLPISTTAENSPSRVLLMQAICLAAASSPRAHPHLKLLLLSESAQNPKDFISYLSQAILTSFDLGMSKDKLVAVQALSVLSLFSQLSNDNHSSAEYCGRAVSYVQTMQLHLDTSRFRKDHQIVTRLFLCVWVLDRLNAALHGRPVLMHERDYGRDMKVSIGEQDSCFQLFLVVVELLDKIIDLYRPSTENQSNCKDEFPSFEDLIIQTGSHRVSGYLIGKFSTNREQDLLFVKRLTRMSATVEVLYHAVSMLSCRFGSLDEPDRSSPASIRQHFSASRVMSIVGSEFSEDIVLLPFVPYAVSLCLRVSYRELRVSKVPLLRARARRQLLTTCVLLRRFDTFASANTMADLAEQTVREMDKVAASIISGHRQVNTGSNTPGEQEANEQPNFSSRNPAAILDPNTGSVRIEQPPVAVENRDLNSFDFDLDFADLPQIDLFEHFDPGFKLPEIDAALAQNIDVSAFADLDFWSQADLTPDGPSSWNSGNLPPIV